MICESLAYLTVQKLSRLFTLQLRPPLSPPQEKTPAKEMIRQYFQTNVLNQILMLNVNFLLAFQTAFALSEIALSSLSLCCRQRGRMKVFSQFRLK